MDPNRDAGENKRFHVTLLGSVVAVIDKGTDCCVLLLSGSTSFQRL